MDPSYILAVAVAELLQYTIAVCTLLSGLAMASFYATENQDLGRMGSIFVALMQVASIAFISTVCMSALYLFAFKYFDQVYQHGMSENEAYQGILNLADMFWINLGCCLLGLFAFGGALGLHGFLRSRWRGIVGLGAVVAGFLVIAHSVRIAWKFLLQS